MLETHVDNGPHIVYWTSRQVARVRGEYATGRYYELYDRDQNKMIDGFTKACVFPTRVAAEAVAANNPIWRTMPLHAAEELFLRDGDSLPTHSVGKK